MPKMSFGTGHHATTRLMIGQVLELDFHGRFILDMGCGTGILAGDSAKIGERRRGLLVEQETECLDGWMVAVYRKAR